MILPAVQDCVHDPVLNMLRTNDFNGYLNPDKGSNKSFLNRKRFDTAYALLKKHLTNSSQASSIADFACGSGNFGLRFAEDGYQVDFFDNEARHFDYIKLKTKAWDKISFAQEDISTYIGAKKYTAAFYGEVIEHMANPLQALKVWRENLVTGGLLCLTTPNGDYVDCREPKWAQVKDQKERNESLANTMGNHVCEFGFQELRDLVKQAGFGVLEHKLINSQHISKRSLLRRILPAKVLNQLDDKWSAKNNSCGQYFGRTQVLVAQRFH